MEPARSPPALAWRDPNHTGIHAGALDI